ncbi:MAG: hypothetical protein FJ254_07490 [Phycisphaerae bacterium]|nr:hypothetical protein [Phycisphaerae bacterium]
MKRLGPVAAALVAGAAVGALLARPLADQASFASSPDALLSFEQGVPSGQSFQQVRVLSPEQMDRIIAVARDLSPDLATRLEESRSRDADSFRTALGAQAKRLGSLAVLRDRRPELYAIRIQELRLEAQVLALGEQLHSAVDAGRTDDAARLEATLRPLVLTFVDSNLRSRAVELASLDSMMRALRVDLERDALERTDTVERWVSALRDGREPAALGGRRPSEPAQASR